MAQGWGCRTANGLVERQWGCGGGGDRERDTHTTRKIVKDRGERRGSKRDTDKHKDRLREERETERETES